MQIRRSLTALAATVAAVSASPPRLGAQIGVQRERNVPTVYAITNARVVPVSGPTLERGTIVIRDGLVMAVGASVTVPGDARIIDGAGLTVYPGLIDANSSIGYAASAGARIAQAGGRGRGGRGGGRGAAAQQGAPGGAPNSLHPIGLQPELAAANLVTPEPQAFAGPRSAGITTVLTVPSRGIFRGLSALINLNGATARAMIVKAPIAEHIGFTPTRGSYPGSLLGVFSALRQQLLDAQHYALEQAAYARNPRGMHRPETDPSLEALQPVLNRQIPVVMEANSKREIERALNLAKEFSLRAIIAGGAEADQVADRLKADDVPVLLSLDFPRRPANASPDADPEPLRTLRARVEAPTHAGKLARAGVRFAFEDGGLTNWSDFLGNVQRSVQNGLSVDQAVRALTLSAAEILGVSDRVGTIEAGKVANLTITRGDLLGGRVTQLFIDGRPVEVRAASGTGGTASAAAGTWTVTVTTNEGERPVTVRLTQQGDQLRGTIQGELGSSEITNGSVAADGSLTFTARVTTGGGTEEATFTGTVTANVMRGTMTVVGHPQATFVGSKPDGGRGGRRGRPETSAGNSASKHQ